jgi:NAD+ synthase (glutamine-hydrolysing)
MQTVKVAALALNQIPLAWEHNQTNILKGIATAREAGVSLLCCPELCITGYGCEDMFLAQSTASMALKVLYELIPATENMIVAVGLPLLYQNNLYNVACLIKDKKILGFVAKQHLANNGVHYEQRWFLPWPKGMIVNIELEGQSYSLGDIIFDFEDFRLGFEICEDAWVIPRTGISLAARGVDIILNPSASHFAFGKSAIRKGFVLDAASSFGVGYLYANLLGNEAGRMIYDGDTLIAAGDKWLACGPRFSFQDRILTTAIFDIERLRAERRSMEKNGSKETNTKKLSTAVVVSHWENSPNLKEEEFSRAVALGLFDYLRKSHSLGFVLNLSGGADSASCACLVYIMLALALQELGFEKFKEKLSYFDFNSNLKSNVDPNPNPNPNLDLNMTISMHAAAQQILPSLLYCLYQRSQNNSDSTWLAALSFAQSLGCPLAQISIDTIIDAYCKMIQPIMGRALNWQEDDIALQNIQARVRAPSIWLLANIRHAILLCPSNRSEASTGYTTMDGDTSGGLCPLGGVDKSFILHWLKWLEREGVNGVGPIPGLQAINALSPTAELRPMSDHQTDEADLMPFVWLDGIEQLFVRDKLTPLEILKALSEKYPQESLAVLAKSIARFFQYWVNSQWKRERLAPAFHVDDQSVDPKTWCRFPILSGGFKRELEEMWAKAQDPEK